MTRDLLLSTTHCSFHPSASPAARGFEFSAFAKGKAFGRVQVCLTRVTVLVLRGRP